MGDSINFASHSLRGVNEKVSLTERFPRIRSFLKAALIASFIVKQGALEWVPYSQVFSVQSTRPCVIVVVVVGPATRITVVEPGAESETHGFCRVGAVEHGGEV